MNPTISTTSQVIKASQWPGQTIGYVNSAGSWVWPTTITTSTGEPKVSKFETAFKIAQLMVDRPAVAANDLKAFLDLVAEIQKALD